MPPRFASVLDVQPRSIGRNFSALSLELEPLGERVSPIVVLDDFTVSAPIFGPHPHAGFSAVTYVLEDSPGALRNRDSLGNEIIMAPGGIVWTQAGSGMLHEELPAQAGRPVHGLQIFVNVKSRNKFEPPRVHTLEAGRVPEWGSADGTRVRVVVGAFGGIASPLVPIEAFNLLDVQLKDDWSFNLPRDHNALLYVLKGGVTARAAGRDQLVGSQQALAIEGAGHVTIAAVHPSHFVLLSAAAIREPMVVHGPFIMNEPSQVEAAMMRYRSGAMGRLAPYVET